MHQDPLPSAWFEKWTPKRAAFFCSLSCRSFAHTLPWLGIAVFSLRSFLHLVWPPFSVQPRSTGTRPSLILKRTPIGWNREHYGVLEDGVVVGRIFLMPIGPRGRPWMWAMATIER